MELRSQPADLSAAPASGTNAPLGAHDIFRHPEKWTPEEARYWTAALNQRAAAPDQAALRAYLLEHCGLKPGDQVLELGCGTGRLLAELARRTGPSGQVIGLEPQPAFCEEATRFLMEEGLSNHAKVLSGRAENIPLPDARVDLCIAQTVLIHVAVEQLSKVLSEVQRVLKPGGVFISIDQDGDTWIIDHPQRSTTRKIVHFNSDYRYADGWTGRTLPRIFREIGFRNIELRTWALTDTQFGSYLHQMAHRIAQAAMEHGALSKQEGEEWLAILDNPKLPGSFFSSIAYLCCQGRK